MSNRDKTVRRLEGILNNNVLPKDCSVLKKSRCKYECRWEEKKGGYLSWVGIGSKTEGVCRQLTKDEIAKELYNSYCSGEEEVQKIIRILENFQISDGEIEKYKKENNLCGLLELTVEKLKSSLEKINKSSSWFSSFGINSLILSNLISFMLGNLAGGGTFYQTIFYGLEYLVKSGTFSYSAGLIFSLGVFYYAVLPLFKKIYRFFAIGFTLAKGTHNFIKSTGGYVNSFKFIKNFFSGDDEDDDSDDETFEDDENSETFEDGSFEDGSFEDGSFEGETFEESLESFNQKLKEKNLELMTKLKQTPDSHYDEATASAVATVITEDLSSKQILKKANIKISSDSIKIIGDIKQEDINEIRNTYSLVILCAYNESRLNSKLLDRALYIKNNVYKTGAKFVCNPPQCFSKYSDIKIDVMLEDPVSIIDKNKVIIEALAEKITFSKNKARYESKKKVLEKQLDLAIKTQRDMERLGFVDQKPIKVAEEKLTKYQFKTKFFSVSELTSLKNKINIDKSIIIAHKYLKDKFNIINGTYLVFTLGEKNFVIKGNSRVEALRLVDDSSILSVLNISLKESKKQENSGDDYYQKQIEKLYNDLITIPGFYREEF